MFDRKQLFGRFQSLLFAAADPVRLDTFRRVFAFSFFLYTAWLFGNASEWLTDTGFHHTRETAHPALPAPLPTMPTWAVPLFGLALFGSTLCLIANYRVKMMSWVTLACAIYILGVDSIAACSMNKHYVVGFMLIAVAPPIRRVNVDSGETYLRQSVWPIRILQATLIVLYFTAGISKVVHGDWWSDQDVLFTLVQGVYRTEFAAWALNTFPTSVWPWVMYGALAFELLAPLLLIPRRLRYIGIAVGILFHVGIALMMKNLVFFSIEMITFYSLFLDTRTLTFLRSWFSRGDDLRGFERSVEQTKRNARTEPFQLDGSSNSSPA